jgi:ATPase subunit of ABC transporter with duplicated ATPase domains
MARPVLSDVVGYVTRKSRIAVVGDNGAGKTTLLRLILGTLEVQVQTAAAAASTAEAEAAAALVHRDQRGKGKGKDKAAPSTAISALAPRQVLRRDPACRMAHVAQNHTEALDARSGISSVDYCTDRFKCSSEDARARLGKFGISGTTALQLMSSLSGGQKARVSLTALTWSNPHILLLDEPTNHLDMSALTALAEALRAFDGAVVLVSHNREFVEAVCNELWTLDAGTCVALILMVP